MTLRLRRPLPLAPDAGEVLPPRMADEEVVAFLKKGRVFRVTSTYGRGARILRAVARQMAPSQNATFKEKRRATRSHRAVASRLLVGVDHGHLVLEERRRLGLAEELYSDMARFSLPLIRTQELHGAAQRFEEGTHLPVLGRRLHPFFGVYLPTRMIHLELFATWLQAYSGPLDRVIDVGTGSGVLGFMVERAGAQEILATDTNPNALESVHREFSRVRPTATWALRQGDLLCGATAMADLIVCNPPWLPGAPQSDVDEGLTGDPDLLGRLLEAAGPRLNPGGRVAVLFSTIATLVRPDLPHPVEKAVADHGWTVVQRMQRRVKGKTREKVEVWELSPPEAS